MAAFLRIQKNRLNATRPWLFLLVVLLLSPFPHPPGAVAGEIKKILVLHSYDLRYPRTMSEMAGMEEVFFSSGEDIQYNVEYLDAKRYHRTEYVDTILETVFEYKLRNRSFDLVLNRHGYYWSPEVRRIIKPGGIFITQQVGNRNDVGIRQLLLAPDPEPIEVWDDLETAVASLEREGFQVIKQLEDVYHQRFYDIGAIVYQLKAVPWQIPDFSVHGYYDRLYEIHQQLERVGYVDVLEHRFFVVAEVPNL